MGCSDIDFHIPKERIQHSTEVLRRLGGEVTELEAPSLTENRALAELIPDPATSSILLASSVFGRWKLDLTYTTLPVS